MSEGHRFELVWMIDKDFTHEETGITARVTKSDERVPNYSVQLATKLGDPRRSESDKRLAPHVRVTRRRDNEFVVVDVASIIIDLIEQAWAHIAESVRRDTEARALQSKPRAAKPGHRGPHQAPKGLKELAKEDRKKYEAKQARANGITTQEVQRT